MKFNEARVNSLYVDEMKLNGNIIYMRQEPIAPEGIDITDFKQTGIIGNFDLTNVAGYNNYRFNNLNKELEALDISDKNKVCKGFIKFKTYQHYDLRFTLEYAVKGNYYPTDYPNSDACFFHVTYYNPLEYDSYQTPSPDLLCSTIKSPTVVWYIHHPENGVYCEYLDGTYGQSGGLVTKNVLYNPLYTSDYGYLQFGYVTGNNIDGIINKSFIVKRIKIEYVRR